MRFVCVILLSTSSSPSLLFADANNKRNCDAAVSSFVDQQRNHRIEFRPSSLSSNRIDTNLQSFRSIYLSNIKTNRMYRCRFTNENISFLSRFLFCFSFFLTFFSVVEYVIVFAVVKQLVQYFCFRCETIFFFDCFYFQFDFGTFFFSFLLLALGFIQFAVWSIFARISIWRTYHFLSIISNFIRISAASASGWDWKFTRAQTLSEKGKHERKWNFAAKKQMTIGTERGKDAQKITRRKIRKTSGPSAQDK